MSFSLQVCLYFYNKLYRGNRATKVDTGSFSAFDSPNLDPLAIAEVDIKSKPGVSVRLSLFCRGPKELVLNVFSPCLRFIVNWDTVWRGNRTEKFQVSTELNRNVGLLRLFPGITAATVRSLALIQFRNGYFASITGIQCPEVLLSRR